MKCLIYTCIYNDLWGTEFGGRPSRKEHYKYSLLNILNLNADKFVCFTSENDLNELELFFYSQERISRDKLRFIVFDLRDSKYFQEISKNKKMDIIKKSDRCHEIQYNKFFWMDLLEDFDDYDRIFWFDAGLSHGGIIPEKYSTGEGYEKHFKFSIFNEDLLKRLCDTSKDNILLCGKNNDGHFFWSQTIPQKFYSNYDRSEHIIGGFFGGTPKQMREFEKEFDQMLSNTLNCGDELYYEELLMSCIYANNKQKYKVLKFDDWYNRDDEQKYGKYVRYFFNTLEIPKTTVASVCFDLQSDYKRYSDSAKKMIESCLKFTNFDIVLLTNVSEEFKDFNDARLKVVDYKGNFEENMISGGKFNMHLKRYALSISKEMGYDNIFYNDCDCFLNGWDRNSFEEKVSSDFDVYFVNHANPQLGGLRKAYKHFQEKIDNELIGLYTDEMDNAPNPVETRIIFKNNEKLTEFLNFWNKISNNNKNYMTYYDGVYFGTSAIYSKMKMGSITRSDEFTKYCFIDHGERLLNCYGETVKI